MEPDKNPADVEEERLMKSLSSARARAHNAFGATHQVGKTLHKPQTAVKPMTAAPVSKPAANSGQIPEWKRKQMEAEEARKREEAEALKKKSELIKEVYTSSPDPKSVAQNVVQPRAAPEPERVAEVPKATTTISRSILDEEAEERARKEEERMLKRTGVLGREAAVGSPAAGQPQGNYFALVKSQTAVRADKQ